MRVAGAHIVTAALVTFSAPAIALSADSYAPPVVKEGPSPPRAFFGKMKGTGQWCAFSLKDWRTRTSHDEVDSEEFGWIRYSQNHLESITVGNQSEDAVTEDRYFFGLDGRVTRMIRSGHYIKAPWASFEYRPTKNGRLALTGQGREVVRRLSSEEEETYIVDWPRYSAFRQVPFAKLIDLSGAVQVKLGCLDGHKHPDP